jgi:hypothetical protein
MLIMRKRVDSSRRKISTTVAPQTLSYLEMLIADGEARNLAEAVDLLVDRLRAMENRMRLERDTAAYFDKLPPKAREEEALLSAALSGRRTGIDFDREP